MNTRGIEVGLVVAVSVALVGLISGVHGTGRQVTSKVSAPLPEREAVPARSYGDMRAAPHGPNAALPEAWWDALGEKRPDLFAPVVQSVEDRRAALARRAERRAFNGAPPTVPHAIDQIGVPACLACHDRGVVVGALVAPAMSHTPYASCVQCHVVSDDPRPAAETPPAPANTFVGLAAPDGGERAWLGAPPTIPHTTRMRERCESCHGVYGALGMRSTHPWRASCTQCHGPSAQLDQRAPAVVTP